MASAAILRALALALLLTVIAAQSDPYLSEIRLFAGNFPPRGWALCNGQLLAINQNQALFALLGTTYGGDGRVTFALPDMRGRMPVGTGGPSGIALGQQGGSTGVTLTQTTMPTHTHGHAGTAKVTIDGANHTHTFTANPQGHTHPFSVPGLTVAPTNTTAVASSGRCVAGTDATFKSNLAKCEVSLPVTGGGTLTHFSTVLKTLSPSGTTDAGGAFSGSGSVAVGTFANSNAGGSQAHSNMQPYQTVTYIIALQGIFPSRN